MTSLIAMFMALLIFVLLFPYSLLVEDDADRGNASLRMKRMSAPGPMSHVPGMPEELRACWDTDGSWDGSSAKIQWQNMATGKIIANHNSAWWRDKIRLNVFLFLTKKSLGLFQRDVCLFEASVITSWLWITAGREEKCHPSMSIRRASNNCQQFSWFVYKKLSMRWQFRHETALLKPGSEGLMATHTLFVPCFQIFH